MDTGTQVVGAQFSDIGPVTKQTAGTMALTPFEPTVGTDLQNRAQMQSVPAMTGAFRLGQTAYFVVEVTNNTPGVVDYAIKPWWVPPSVEFTPLQGTAPVAADWVPMCKRLDVASGIGTQPIGTSLSVLLDEVWEFVGLAAAEIRRVAFVCPAHGFGLGVTTQMFLGAIAADAVSTKIYFSVGVSDAIVQESIT